MHRLLPTRFLQGSAALHAAGLVGLAVAPRQWPLVLATLVADHLAIVAAGLVPRSRLLGPNLTRLGQPAAGAAPRVALTFDDGPDPVATPQVLALLERHGARASFFCIGRRAEAAPDLVTEIARRGHAVENHSYRHATLFSLFGPRAVARDVDRAQDVLERLAGRRPLYFRAPAGLRGPFLEPILRRRGLRLVSWTRRGFDTVTRDAGLVVTRLVRGLAADDVLLLHDAARAARSASRAVVLDALPRLLDELAARGLRAEALPRPDAAPREQGAR